MNLERANPSLGSQFWSRDPCNQASASATARVAASWRS